MKTKLLIIILLFPLMANMPVSAQAPTAAISLSCPDFDFEYIYNEDISNESPISEVTCTANNPTTYQEKISIQVNTERNITSTAPGEIYVGGNQEVEFNVTITDSVGKKHTEYICQSCFTVTVTVQEINSLPPLNTASSSQNLSISLLSMVENSKIGMPTPLLEGQIYAGENWTGSSFDEHFNPNLNAPFSQPWTALQFIDTDCGYCIQMADEMGSWSNQFDSNDFSNGMPEVEFFVSSTQLNIGSHNSSREEIEAFRDKTSGHQCASTDCSNRPGSEHNLITYIDDLDQDNMISWGIEGTPSYTLVQPDGILAFSSNRQIVWDASANSPFLFQGDLADVIIRLIPFSDQPPVPDSDGDGIPDNSDAFPNDENESQDSDGDGVGDNSDAFPNDGNETQDDDGDGVGNNSDAFPQDGNETHDDDGDGVGNNSDAFPQDGNETHDDDGDGVGNNSDAFPQDENETLDTDSDGVGDNEDPEPENPDVRTPQDISVEISDRSSYLIAGSIVFLAIIILFVRRKQPPQSINESPYVEEDSMWND